MSDSPSPFRDPLDIREQIARFDHNLTETHKLIADFAEGLDLRAEP